MTTLKWWLGTGKRFSCNCHFIHYDLILIDLSISSSLVKIFTILREQTIYLSTFFKYIFQQTFYPFSITLKYYFFIIYLIFFLFLMCTKNRERVVGYFNQQRERGLNILVIKIHLENNSNSPCVESIVANLLYFFFFTHFREIVGVEFCGFAPQTWLQRVYWRCFLDHLRFFIYLFIFIINIYIYIFI